MGLQNHRKPPSRKRHDDSIDGDGVAGLYIYFLNRRIEFGAQSSFHFHRLDDAKGFARFHRPASNDLYRFDEGGHWTSQQFRAAGCFFLWHERGKLRLAPRVDLRLSHKAGVRQSIAVQNTAQLNHDPFAVDRAVPNWLTWDPIGTAEMRVPDLLKSHNPPLVPVIERHVMTIFAKHDRAHA